MNGYRKLGGFEKWNITWVLKNKTMNFSGQLIELEKKVILIEVIQTWNDKYGMYSLVCGH